MIRRLLLLAILAYVVIAIKKVGLQSKTLRAADSLALADWESEGGPAPPAEAPAPVG